MDNQQATRAPSNLIGGGKQLRNSSIELFRILVTMLVLIVHMNGYFVGLNTHDFNFHSFPQIVVEALSCIAVNGFILITGYFGINKIFHTLWKLWQSLFCIYVPLFVLKYIFDKPDYGFAFQDLLNAIFPFSTRDGYFINGYIFLVLASPFINAFISSSDKKKVLLFTISLLLFEFWVDCICNLRTFFFNEGYSGLHFCLLYLMGRCLSLYYDRLKRIRPPIYLAVYLFLSLIVVVLSVLKIPWTYNYSNIFLVLSASSLFMVFATRQPFYNIRINKIAQCSLFVYILQINSPFMGWLCTIDNYLLENMSWGIYIISIVLVCAGFYMFCFIWDYLRRLVTTKVFDKIEYKVSLFLR